MVAVQAWPVKRAMVARLKAVVTGSIVVPGTTALVSPGGGRTVQVAHVIPAEPDPVCVYGTAIQLTRHPATAEHGGVAQERCPLEVRIRVTEPGEDVEAADQLAGDLVNAVATAVLAEPRLCGTTGSLTLLSVSQDPIARAPSPEPEVRVNVGVTFLLEVATT
jgi:hypothetical protein